MPRKSVPLLLTALLSAPLPVFALGLGEIALDSSLNEPLNARINLDSVQPGDLTNFKATVASGETFSRYGLDRPDFLNTLRFEIDVDTGRPLLLVSSTSAITEPFLTFLVEANWDSGRLLREYTVLLDPPVFNPQSATAPIRAPQTATSQLDSSSGFVPRPTPVPAPAPKPRRPVAAAIAGESYGPVQRNETLWAIADRARAGTGLSINQMMLAIYDANPEAFLGNINLLKEGSTLALPGSNLAAQISRQDAFARARDHNQRWRAGGTVARTAPSTQLAATPAEDDGRRLKLVAPDGGSTDAGLSAIQQQLEEEQARNTELSEQIDVLRGELADNERLVNLQNSGLADVQASLAEQQAREAAEQEAVDASQTEFEPAPEVDEALATTDPAQVADNGDGAPGPDGSPPVDTPPDAMLEPEPVTAPATTVATVPTPIQSAPSLLDRIIGAWPFALGALALLGGLLFWRSRSSDESGEDESWEALSRSSSIPTTDTTAAAAATGIGVTEGQMADEDVEYFEDTGTFKPIDFSEAEAEVGLEREAQNADAPAPAVDFPFEDTLAGDEALKLDQSDPLAEADFHIAYGLYDQAADLVRAASEREPERRDLKMKLLEIFFVWGNKDSFLSSAATLRSDIGDGPDRDWDKVVIMGRQICPGDDLFTGETVGATADMVDLQLDETGETPIDLSTETVATDHDMDFDLGEALDASTEATGTVDNVIDFDFSGTSTSFDDDADNETVAQKIDALESGSDDTEEIALSDVGIDIDFGDSDAIDESLASAALDTGATGQAEVLDIDIGEDFDELFSGLDDVADEPEALLTDDDATDHAKSLADVVAAEQEEHDKLLDTSELKVEMEELLASAAAMDSDDNAQASSHDVFKSSEETGSFSAEIQSLANDSVDFDIDFGAADDDDDATELMEGISLDDTQEGRLSESFSENVFGSDDDTVLASALPDPAGDGFGDDEFGEIFADDSDSGTAVMKVSDQDFSGDNDATVLAQMPIDAPESLEASNDSLTFDGVFDKPDDDVTQETAFDLGDDDFSAAVFGESAGESDSTQESAGIDLDVGEAMFDPEPGSGDNTTVKVAAQELALPDIDEGGSSEVGTKLDLARAYMEMGDPDGARGILQEVIDEGDDGQKQDARALLDALP